MIFRFKNFKVYKDARVLRKEIKLLSKEKFPKDEKMILTSQLWRALDSILLNIAEGSDRYSDIDFSRFLNNALTSLNEVIACLDAAEDDKYINHTEYETIFKKADLLARQLMAFSKSIRNPSK